MVLDGIVLDVGSRFSLLIVNFQFYSLSFYFDHLVLNLATTLSWEGFKTVVVSVFYW